MCRDRDMACAGWKFPPWQTRLNQFENTNLPEFFRKIEIISNKLRNHLFKCLIVNPGWQPGAIWVSIPPIKNLLQGFSNVIILLVFCSWEESSAPYMMRRRTSLEPYDIDNVSSQVQNCVEKWWRRGVLLDNESKISFQESIEKSWPYPRFASQKS